MKHLRNSFIGRNNLWRYIVMCGAIFLATNTVGAIPLLIGLFIKAASDPASVSAIASNQGNLPLMGFNPNMLLLIMIFPFIVGLIAFMLLIKPLNGRTLMHTITGAGNIRWGRMLISALIWLILSSAYLAVYRKIDPGNFALNNTSESLIVLIIISVLFIPFQAAFEEIIFRGYLLQGFTFLVRNRWLPAIITSLLFGLMHAWNPEIKEYGFFSMYPQYFLSGLLFAIITIIDDGTELAIGAHAANNVFLSIMVTNDSSILQTPAVFRQIELVPGIEFAALAACSLIFIIAMKVIFRWKYGENDLSLREVDPTTVQEP